MKIRLTVFIISSVLISSLSYAQSKNSLPGTDTITYQLYGKFGSTDSTTYVVDGKPVDKIDNINSKNIFSIEVIKNAQGSITNEPVNHKTVLITTNAFVIDKYESKLSPFSAKYKKYIEVNKGDDANVLYVLNGEPLKGDNQISLLKKLPKDSIKSVDLMGKYYKGIFNNKKDIVVIATNK